MRDRLSWRSWLLLVLIVGLAGAAMLEESRARSLLAGLVSDPKAACRAHGELDENLACRDRFFDEVEPSILEIEVKESELSAATRADRYISAEVRYDGTRWLPVGFKEKSLRNPQALEDTATLKTPALELNFARFLKSSFYGLKRVTLSSIENDGDLFKETTAHEIFRAFSLIVPRERLLRVKLNGKARGLFRLREPVDIKMMGDYFGRSQGDYGHVVSGLQMQMETRDMRELGVPTKYLINYLLASVLSGDPNGYFNDDNTAFYHRKGSTWPVPLAFFLPFRWQCDWKKGVETGIYSDFASDEAVHNSIFLLRSFKPDAKKLFKKMADDALTDISAERIFSESVKAARKKTSAVMSPSSITRLDEELAEMRKDYRCGVELVRDLVAMNFSEDIREVHTNYESDLDKTPAGRQPKPRPKITTPEPPS